MRKAIVTAILLNLIASINVWSPNLVTNGDAENSTFSWQSSKIKRLQFILKNKKTQDVGWLYTNGWSEDPEMFTPPITSPPDPSFGLMAWAGSGEPTTTNTTSVLITSASQVFQLPEDAWNPLNFDNNVIYNISTDFFWVAGMDYSTIEFNFLNSDGLQIENAQDFSFPNTSSTLIAPPITTIPGTHYHFRQKHGGKCPKGTKFLRITMNFFAGTEIGQTSSTAYMDNIFVAFQFKLYVPEIKKSEDGWNSLSFTGKFGIIVGGLGMVLLLLLIPICTCFKKEGKPILKNFTLKRRNTSVKNSVKRKNSLFKKQGYSNKQIIGEIPETKVYEVGKPDEVLDYNTAYNAKSFINYRYNTKEDYNT
ncbi:hypothetical protein HK099_008518, partial [Clydaea vesicula]